MTITKRNIMVPVDQIEPHPDNPRKDVGDVTELAESIKKNGIFQNLTILRTPNENGKSTVIIGHRRLAAAKLAGLKKVPCAVVEMDEDTQFSTMLLENMQRSDLTVLEQADGIQQLQMRGFSLDEIRQKTMPIARKYSIEELLQSCRDYFDTTGRRVTFEYSMISGVNDSDENARELANRLSGMNCHVNLIPVNTVEGTGYIKSNIKRQQSFIDILAEKNITATVRRTLGSDINASCGQLKRNHILKGGK